MLGLERERERERSSGTSKSGKRRITEIDVARNHNP